MPASQITITQLRAVFPKVDFACLGPINDTLVRYDITTKVRKACFLAQAGHESANFTRFEENLNYSAQGLVATFPKHFPNLAAAQPYARNPQKIANIVYANRMGNGAPGSGDGWMFRGRGAIQITGREQYERFAQAIGKSLTDTVAYLAGREGAFMSAGWYWSANNLNAIADSGDMKTLTRHINGGLNGLVDRLAIYDAAQAVL